MRASWGWLRILICLSLLWWAPSSSGEQDLEEDLDVSQLSTSSSIAACPTHFDQGGEEITIVPAITTAAEDVTRRHFGLKVHKWRCTCKKCPDLSDDACDVSNCIENDGTAQQPVITPGVVVRYRIAMQAYLPLNKTKEDVTTTEETATLSKMKEMYDKYQNDRINELERTHHISNASKSQDTFDFLGGNISTAHLRDPDPESSSHGNWKPTPESKRCYQDNAYCLDWRFNESDGCRKLTMMEIDALYPGSNKYCGTGEAYKNDCPGLKGALVTALKAICPSVGWEHEVKKVRPFASGGGFTHNRPLLAGPGFKMGRYTAVNKYRVPSSPKLVDGEWNESWVTDRLGPQNGDQRSLVDFMTVLIGHTKAKKAMDMELGGVFRFAMQFTTCKDSQSVSGMVVVPPLDTKTQFLKPLCNGTVTLNEMDNAVRKVIADGRFKLAQVQLNTTYKSIAAEHTADVSSVGA